MATDARKRPLGLTEKAALIMSQLPKKNHAQNIAAMLFIFPGYL